MKRPCLGEAQCREFDETDVERPNNGRDVEFTDRADRARPRQTDVLAAKVAEVYLIECKWRSDKANIDSLRSRLRRTNCGVVDTPH